MADATYDTLRSFLEDGGLYKSKPITDCYVAGPEFLFPRNFKIEMPCLACKNAKRTFVYVATTPAGTGGTLKHFEPLVLFRPKLVKFVCTHCDVQELAFLLVIYNEKNEFWIHKAGQWPSSRPQPSKEMAKALGGASAKLYSKGLTAEKFGFGIGAFGYYRRVTEDIIDRLMKDLRRYAEDSGSPALVSAIDRTAAETVAAKRIEAVKDLLPNTLRPDGLNPLGTMYGALSDGLHGQSDEECLELAEHLRTALDFVVTRLATHQAENSAFVKAAKRLQEKPKAKAEDEEPAAS